jgi:hypothetical protein
LASSDSTSSGHSRPARRGEQQQRRRRKVAEQPQGIVVEGIEGHAVRLSGEIGGGHRRPHLPAQARRDGAVPGQRDGQRQQPAAGMAEHAKHPPVARDRAIAEQRRREEQQRHRPLGQQGEPEQAIGQVEPAPARVGQQEVTPCQPGAAGQRREQQVDFRPPREHAETDVAEQRQYRERRRTRRAALTPEHGVEARQQRQPGQGRGQAHCPFVGPAAQRRHRRAEPVVQRRLVDVHGVVQARHQPVAAGVHGLDHRRAAALVLRQQRHRAQAQREQQYGQHGQQRGAAARVEPAAHGVVTRHRLMRDWVSTGSAVRPGGSSSRAPGAMR